MLSTRVFIYRRLRREVVLRLAVRLRAVLRFFVDRLRDDLRPPDRFLVARLRELFFLGMRTTSFQICSAQTAVPKKISVTKRFPS